MQNFTELMLLLLRCVQSQGAAPRLQLVFLHLSPTGSIIKAIGSRQSPTKALAVLVHVHTEGSVYIYILTYILNTCAAALVYGCVARESRVIGDNIPIFWADMYPPAASSKA